MEPITTNASELGNSVDLLAQRQQELLVLIRQTAPEVISDNQIDIQALKVLLGEESIAPAEHYELSWAGKSAARREIQKTSSHTLLPAADNPERATHMLIEGENLEVLRVLQKSYYGKVKMIYIDPPYNTGNDSFVYPDDYSETLDEYQKRTGEKSEAGFLNKQSLWKKNSKESGQYHSVWLSMMYPRLYLARNLLRDDGVIFISIDDNEQANLKRLCDEIFGEQNFLTNISVKLSEATGVKMAHAKQRIPKLKEYLLAYRKNSAPAILPAMINKEKWDSEYRTVCLGLTKNELGKIKEVIEVDDNRSQSDIQLVQELLKKISFDSASSVCKIETGGALSDEWLFNNAYRVVQVVTMTGGALAQAKKMQKLISPSVAAFEIITPNNKMYLVKTDFNHESDLPRCKILFADQYLQVNTGDFWSDIKTTGLDNEGGVDFKNGKKPLKLLKRCIQLIADSESSDLILDFFSGSGTTAQAVMELNLEDGGNRQCICVQMPEVLDETSESYKVGYRTIVDITRARIEKVIAKLKVEHPDKTADLACANFTLAPSNFKVWRSELADANALREQLALFQSAEKNNNAHREADKQTAMLTELLLKHGLGALGVHANARPLKVAGVTIHRVQMHHDAALWLCFEPYTDELKDEITKAKPAQVILLNSCFASDKADEQISNLQLELDELDIRLTII